MKQNANAQTFKGTVAELAGKMALNGEILNLQDVQFLTRIGRDSFAKRVGTAPGSGTRGGKRATIWEINPSARLAFQTADMTPTKTESKANAAPKPNSKAFQNAVQEAVQKIMAGQSTEAAAAPKRRRPRKSAAAE